MRCRVLSLNQMGIIGTMRRCVKRSLLEFEFFLYKTAFFCSLYLLSLSIHLFFCLFCTCVHYVHYVCIMHAQLSMLFALRVFFMQEFSAQAVYLKFCPGATLETLVSTAEAHTVGAHTIMITQSLLFICTFCSADARLIEPLLSSGVHNDNSGRFTTEKPSLQKKSL